MTNWEKKDNICTKCEGSGELFISDLNITVTCIHCGGKGKVSFCSKCDGKGEIVEYAFGSVFFVNCDQCKGSGTEP